MATVSIADGLDRLEKMSEDELRAILSHVFYKIETLGNIMKIDVQTIGALKRIMRYVLSLNILLVDSSTTHEDDEEMKNTQAVLSKIKSANLNKLEETLYLARDIAREYYIRCGMV